MLITECCWIVIKNIYKLKCSSILLREEDRCIEQNILRVFLGAQDSIYTIASAIMNDSGIYICEVTNTVATELILYSKQINLTVGNPVGLYDDDTKLRASYQLLNNYPNPFNPSTKINYSIPKQSYVTLKVYDVLGREISTLVNKEEPPGNYEVEYDASNLTSGIYFYRIQTGDFEETKKMVLMK